MKRVMLPILVACCLAPAAAFASHPLVGDSAGTVEEKHVEAETALEYHLRDADGAKAKSFDILETVTFGLLPKVDAFVSVPFKFISPDGGSSENGLTDISLGIKWNFYKVGSTEFAIKPVVTLPTGDKDKAGGEFGTGKSSFGGVLVASTEISNEVNVHANVGIMHQLAPTEGDDYNTVSLSLSGTYDVTKALKAVAEVAAAKADRDGEKWGARFTVGAIFAAQKNIDVDCGISYSKQDKDTDVGILGGVTFKF